MAGLKFDCKCTRRIYFPKDLPVHLIIGRRATCKDCGLTWLLTFRTSDKRLIATLLP